MGKSRRLTPGDILGLVIWTGQTGAGHPIGVKWKKINEFIEFIINEA